jgi:hypothetical protein
MHDSFCSAYFPPEYISDALVSQAYSQYRQFTAEMPDNVVRDTCLQWCVRARGYDNPLRFKLFDFWYSNFIVAFYQNILFQLPEILPKIIGKAVVVIDE